MSAPGTDDRAPARARIRRRAVAVAAAVAVPLILGGCQVPNFWGYRGKSTQAQDTFKLYAGTFIAAIVVGIIVAALIIWAIVAYRRRGSDEMPRQFQYHIPLEITYTVIPVIIVLILFAFTVVTENRVDAITSSPAVRVKVIAFQWGWTYVYQNEHVVVTGETTSDPDPIGLNGGPCAPAQDCYGPGLVLPVNATTTVQLVSNDTIHGFYVPVFNFSRYAQPGVTQQFFDLTPTKVGIFRAQCTQLCGLYHSLMFFHVVVLPMDQFKTWIHGTQTRGGTLTAGTDTGLGTSPSIPVYPGTATTTTTAPVSSTTTTAPVSSTTTSTTKAAA